MKMKTILSFAALAVTALALQSYRAEAQDATASSTSNSSSGAASQSGSFSRSQGGAGGTATSTSGSSANNQQSRQAVNTGLTLNQNGVAQPANTNASGTYSNNTSGFTSSDVTVRTTPTVYAPPVSGGNPCTLAVSGGVSVIGWGAAAGGTFVDEDCATRQKIAMIHNAGYAGAAKELMCNDKATYFAFRSSGQPCQPRPQFDGPPVIAGGPRPTPQPVPVQIAPPPQQMVTKDRTNLPRCSRTITDNCYGG
jgi:hypothetical protein